MSSRSERLSGAAEEEEGVEVVGPEGTVGVWMSGMWRPIAVAFTQEFVRIFYVWYLSRSLSNQSEKKIRREYIEKTPPLAPASSPPACEPEQLQSTISSKLSTSTDTINLPPSIMLRTNLARSITPALRNTTRSITTTAIRMGEGDTGGVRPGGVAQGFVHIALPLLPCLPSYTHPPPQLSLLQPPLLSPAIRTVSP